MDYACVCVFDDAEALSGVVNGWDGVDISLDGVIASSGVGCCRHWIRCCSSILRCH